ncbi:MAG: hypothetical protein U0637_00655 [Phycisphaerales bacterium]
MPTHSAWITRLDRAWDAMGAVLAVCTDPITRDVLVRGRCEVLGQADAAARRTVRIDHAQLESRLSILLLAGQVLSEGPPMYARLVGQPEEDTQDTRPDGAVIPIVSGVSPDCAALTLDMWSNAAPPDTTNGYVCQPPGLITYASSGEWARSVWEAWNRQGAPRADAAAPVHT